jgi:hypothetical protein
LTTTAIHFHPVISLGGLASFTDGTNPVSYGVLELFSLWVPDSRDGEPWLLSIVESVIQNTSFWENIAQDSHGLF